MNRYASVSLLLVGCSGPAFEWDHFSVASGSDDGGDAGIVAPIDGGSGDAQAPGTGGVGSGGLTSRGPGGSVAAGGSGGASGATGGSPTSSGGTPIGNGGEVGTGGASASTGGAPSSGGAASSGGVTSSGGTSSSGGAPICEPNARRCTTSNGVEECQSDGWRLVQTCFGSVQECQDGACCRTKINRCISPFETSPDWRCCPGLTCTYSDVYQGFVCL